MAVRLEAAAPNEPVVVRDRTPLFRAPYPGGVIPMYDGSPDGSRFIIAGGYERANRLVVTLNALSAERVNAPRAAPPSAEWPEPERFSSPRWLNKIISSMRIAMFFSGM